MKTLLSVLAICSTLFLTGCLNEETHATPHEEAVFRNPPAMPKEAMEAMRNAGKSAPGGAANGGKSADTPQTTGN